MDVVVVGAGGLLGQDVVRACKQRGFNVIAPTRVQLDVTSDLSVDKFFVGFRADWIINCAAYVAVDDAEKESDAAFLLNAEAAGKVARAGAQLGARVIQISTDFVFDGRKNRPYIESDEVNPIGVYGASKLEGERRAIQENAGAIIARTAWLYGTGRSNFPLKILEAARSGKSLRLVSDRVGSGLFIFEYTGDRSGRR